MKGEKSLKKRDRKRKKGREINMGYNDCGWGYWF